MAYVKTNVLDNQIKALPTIASASGSIATFTTDKAERLVDCEVQIVATGGGGTPTTPIAINGFSQAVVNLSEKNLFDKSKYMNLTTDYDYISSGGVQYKCKKIYLAKGLTVTVSQSASTTSSVVLLMHNVPQVNASGYFDLRTAGGSKTFTTSEEGCLYIGVYGSNDTDCNARLNECNVQIEKGNQATTYEAYNGNTYNIPFGQTIYGGVLNVGSGVLRVTHRYVDLSTLTWIYNSSATAFYSADDIGEYRGVGNLGLCEIYTVVDNVSAISNLPATNYIICGYTSTSNHRLYVRNTDYTDETAFTNSMSGKYFAYRLATSTEIQLDSTAIQTIANSENNIWSDTGDISVQFVLSVGSYVNQNV